MGDQTNLQMTWIVTTRAITAGSTAHPIKRYPCTVLWPQIHDFYSCTAAGIIMFDPLWDIGYFRYQLLLAMFFWLTKY